MHMNNDKRHFISQPARIQCTPYQPSNIAIRMGKADS